MSWFHFKPAPALPNGMKYKKRDRMKPIPAKVTWLGSVQQNKSIKVRETACLALCWRTVFGNLRKERKACNLSLNFLRSRHGVQLLRLQVRLNKFQVLDRHWRLDGGY
jgi:hypothetical protein